MKNTIIALALAATTGVAMASEYGEARFALKEDNARATSKVFTGVFGAQFGSWAGDVKGETSRRDANHTYTNTLQGRGTYDFGPAWARGGLGKSFANGGNDYNFYTYAVGSKYAIDNKWAVVGEAERQNALKAGNPKTTNVKVGAEYALSKNDVVEGFWSNTIGDRKDHSVGAGLKHKF